MSRIQGRMKRRMRKTTSKSHPLLNPFSISGNLCCLIYLANSSLYLFTVLSSSITVTIDDSACCVTFVSGSYMPGYSFKLYFPLFALLIYPILYLHRYFSLFSSSFGSTLLSYEQGTHSLAPKERL